MKLHPSKAILKALDSHEQSLYKQGFFPEVNFQKGDFGYSFNLFEKMDVGKLLFKCLNFNMVQLGIEYGAFTRKHGDKFIAEIEKDVISQMVPVTSEHLKSKNCIGNSLKLWGIEDRFSFRCGKIAENIYMDNIFDVSITEENGYSADFGSAYTWETAMICVANGELGGIWRPFHLSEEEKQIKKEIYGR